MTVGTEALLAIVGEDKSASVQHWKTSSENHAALQQLIQRRRNRKRNCPSPKCDSSSSSNNHTSEQKKHQAWLLAESHPFLQKLRQERALREKKEKDIIRIIQTSCEAELPEDKVAELKVQAPWMISRPNKPFTEEETREMFRLIGLGFNDACRRSESKGTIVDPNGYIQPRITYLYGEYTAKDLIKILWWTCMASCLNAEDHQVWTQLFQTAEIQMAQDSKESLLAKDSDGVLDVLVYNLTPVLHTTLGFWREIARPNWFES
eukprot:TRINITY_DN67716_c1_g1_i1.p1 TRINITY_DN67716_c1_g1~~TRINITY_DN67716_c1_g1_i1.p1  ORF type:complete len:263 (-),score=26.99 TRINITY_DN67716_c1_g1_i1:207-995(-)